jgi:hypothetical protein
MGSGPGLLENQKSKNLNGWKFLKSQFLFLVPPNICEMGTLRSHYNSQICDTR